MLWQKECMIKVAQADSLRYKGAAGWKPDLQ